MCSKREAIYSIHQWEEFYKDRKLFARNIVHLNAVGAAHLGRVLEKKKYNQQNKAIKVKLPHDTTAHVKGNVVGDGSDQARSGSLGSGTSTFPGHRDNPSNITLAS